MMAAKNVEKMTYVTALEMAVKCEALSPEVREKLEALRVQQEKRNSTKSGKPTKAQRENEALAQEVLACMTSEHKTLTEWLEALPEGLREKVRTTQKMVGLMKNLPVKSEKAKGKTLYWKE